MKPMQFLIALVMMAGLSACTRPKQAQTTVPTRISTQSTSTSDAIDSQQTSPVDNLNSVPDFGSMSFVEQNDLYIQLLQEKQNAGAATNKAENEYINFLEASLRNDTMLADEYLQKAIMLLWDL